MAESVLTLAKITMQEKFKQLQRWTKGIRDTTEY